MNNGYLRQLERLIKDIGGLYKYHEMMSDDLEKTIIIYAHYIQEEYYKIKRKVNKEKNNDDER